MLRVDDKIIYGVEQPIPYRDPIFPQSPVDTTTNKIYDDHMREIKKYGIDYLFPDHYMYVYTNVPGVKIYYLHNRLLGFVRTKINVGDVYPVPDNKGIYIVSYYCVYNMSACTRRPRENYEAHITLDELLEYYIRYATGIRESELKDIQDIIRETMRQSPIWDKVIIRMIDFIPIGELMKVDNLYLQKHDMVFSRDITSLNNKFKENISNNMVTLDTTNRTIIEIEYVTNKGDTKFIKFMDGTISVNPKIDITREDSVMKIKTYNNGIMVDEKIINDKEELSKHLYNTPDASIENDEIKEIADKINKDLAVAVERIKAAANIKEQLLKKHTQLFKLTELIAKNELAMAQLERSGFKDLAEILKSLANIF